MAEKKRIAFKNMEVRGKLSRGFFFFDRMVLSILLYWSKILGYKHKEYVEQIQIYFCKRPLKINNSVRNQAVLGELGRFPISTLHEEVCYIG